MPRLRLNRDSGNRQKHESGNPLQRFVIDRMHAEVCRLLGRVSPTHVLDLGCGEGYVLEALAEAGIDATLVGVDRSTSAVALARERLGERAEIIEGDVTHQGDLGSSFDVVMMLEVLEHLDQPEAALEMLATLTTGHVVVSVPREPFFRGLNLLRLKNVRRYGSDPEHIHHWTRRAFERTVEDHFTVIERGRAFPWTLLLAKPRADLAAGPG